MKKIISIIITLVLVISCATTTYAVAYFCGWGPECPGVYNTTCEKCGGDWCCFVCGHCEDCANTFDCECQRCKVCGCGTECIECPTCGGDVALCPTCKICANGCESPLPEIPEGDVLHSEGTIITATGQYTEAEYTITVPAQLSAGETGNVTVVGAWKRTQTLKVSCPNKVTMSYGDQTFDIGITFEGINQVGSDIEPFNITKPVSVENKSVLFGVWTGHLDYVIEFINN